MKKIMTALERLVNRKFYGREDYFPTCEAWEYKRADIAKVKQEAQRGDLEAQHALACRYYYGKDVPQNHKEAAEWFRLAAEQKHLASQNCICLMCYRGIGIPKDKKEALKWLLIRAKRGVAVAQSDLGEAYLYGKYGILQKNYYDAYIWLSLASATSDPLGPVAYFARIHRNMAARKLKRADLIHAQGEALKRWEEIRKQQQAQ